MAALVAAQQQSHVFATKAKGIGQGKTLTRAHGFCLTGRQLGDGSGWGSSALARSFAGGALTRFQGTSTANQTVLFWRGHPKLILPKLLSAFAPLDPMGAGGMGFMKTLDPG